MNNHSYLEDGKARENGRRKFVCTFVVKTADTCKWDAQQGLSKINFWETINYQRLQSINLILEKINHLVAINCN